MAKINFNALPRFSQLPVKAGKPPESSWGVFGDDDELGCINFLTAEGVVEAAKLIKKGAIFRLDWPIGYPDPPLFNRAQVQHTIIPFERIPGHDDKLDNYNTQSTTQWDGLAHVGHPEYGFYNGFQREHIKSGPEGKLSIHLWADRFVGRGVLIDVHRYLTEQGRPLNPESREWVTVADLQAAAQNQHLEMKFGDILLIRTGWMRHFLDASPEDKVRIAKNVNYPGIEPARETVEWLWDNRVTAVATDCPAVEPIPWHMDKGPLHFRMLALLGMPMGEQFDLEALAEDCAQDSIYEFFFVSMPLVLRGGIASPPNAAAIK
jgi:kynurenine formamidase